MVRPIRRIPRERTVGTYYVHVQAKDEAGNESVISPSSDSIEIIDTTAPTILSAAGPEATATSYKDGNTVVITVTFNEEVRVAGTPELTLQIGGPTGTMGTAAFSGTPILSAPPIRLLIPWENGDNGEVVITNVTMGPGGSIRDDDASP